MGATDLIHIPRIFELLRSEWFLTGEAELAAGFLKCRIDADAFVKDEALSIPVSSAAFLEIFQDATLELIDFAEACHLEEGSGLLAANTTCAEADNGSLFQCFGELLNRVRKFAEVANRKRYGARKGAELHFIGISSVEEGDGASLIQPTLKFFGR